MKRAAHAAFAISACGSFLLGLSACVTLLPKQAPAHLYRFGSAATVGEGGAPPALTIHLPAAAQGDGILAMTGNRAAYIAGARWVSPAAILFQEAATRALSPATALLTRPWRLTLNVVRFEADYDPAKGAAPTVRVDALAAFTDDRGHERPLGRFSSERQATDNRVGAIVGAYDSAVADVLGALAAKLAKAGTAPPAPQL